MFAKRTWFRTSQHTVLPTPERLEGWLFYAVAILVMGLPTIWLLFRLQFFPEATIWIAISTLMFVWEIRTLKLQIAKWESRRDLFYISDVPTNQE